MLTEDETKPWTACYFRMAHSDGDYLRTKLFKQLPEGAKYIISKETTAKECQDFSGQHFHVFAQIPKQKYENLVKNMKDKFPHFKHKSDKLKSNMYGKVKQLRSYDLMAAYTVKDDNYETNIEQEIMEKIKKLSYEKGTTSAEEAKKKRKLKGSWIVEVVDELNEKYPTKKWNMNLEVDFDTLTKFMILKLGKAAKPFDEFVFDRLFVCILANLKKDEEFEERYFRKLTQKSRDRFTQW